MLGGMGCRGSDMKAGFRACLNQAGMKLTFVCLGGQGQPPCRPLGAWAASLSSLVGRSFGRSVSRSATVILEISPSLLHKLFPLEAIFWQGVNLLVEEFRFLAWSESAGGGVPFPY